MITRPVRFYFVVQCRSNGLFLTNELDWARSLRFAGRLFDPEEALNTALDNLDPDDFEIHPLVEVLQ